MLVGSPRRVAWVGDHGYDAPERFLADMQRNGLDFICTDPVAQRAVATIHLATAVCSAAVAAG